MNGRDASLYERVGAGFFASLVDAFYDGVETDQVLMVLYPEGTDTIAARARLTMFLVQYFGGPHDYLEQRGHPMLRMRHGAFAIGAAERDRWLVHMASAIERVTADLPESVRDDVIDELAHYMVNAAEHLRNR